jgi:putative membrane protein
MMMGMIGGMGGCMAGMGMMGLLGLLLLAGLVAGLVYLARGFGRGRQTVTAGDGAGEDHALTVLRERYARGEVDHEEYERRRVALGEREWGR